MPLTPNPDTAHPPCRGHPHTDGGGVSRETWGSPLTSTRASAPPTPVLDFQAWSARFPESPASLDVVTQEERAPGAMVSLPPCVNI